MTTAMCGHVLALYNVKQGAMLSAAADLSNKVAELGMRCTSDGDMPLASTSAAI
jgi:hypothetical protein